MSISKHMQFFVDKVQKNEDDTIINLHVQYVMAGFVLNNWVSRARIIMSIATGDSVYTIVESPDGDPIMQEISILHADGENYIRSDKNEILEDYLDNVPFEVVKE